MPCIVWRQTTKDIIRFSTSDTDGAEWSTPATIPNIVARPYYEKHQFDRYALAAIVRGGFICSRSARLDSPDHVALFHLEMRDGTWSAPQTLYSGEGFPEYPGVATDGGNRFVVSFFVRDTLFDVGNYRIWWANGVADTAPVARQAVPTIVPTAVSAPTIVARHVAPDRNASSQARCRQMSVPALTARRVSFRSVKECLPLPE